MVHYFYSTVRVTRHTREFLLPRVRVGPPGLSPVDIRPGTKKKMLIRKDENALWIQPSLKGKFKQPQLRQSLLRSTE